MKQSVFICYSHADKSWLDRLLIHLAPLRNSTEFEIFSDRDIRPNDEWRGKISESLKNATIGILLVSPDFIASDFIREKELPELLGGREKGKIRLFSLIVRPCLFERTDGLDKYQAFNSPDSPLSALSETASDQLFVDLARETIIASETKPSDVPVALPRTDEEWQLLPEMDYDQASARKSYSNEKVSVPKLIARLDITRLAGYSFDGCLIRGPQVFLMRSGSLDSNEIGSSAGAKNLLYKPSFEEFGVGRSREFFQLPIGKYWIRGSGRDIGTPFCRRQFRVKPHPKVLDVWE